MCDIQNGFSLAFYYVRDRYVYTAYDEREDSLSGLVEVETGVSDGEVVEILSGLSLGDSFYYRYADTVTYSFLAKA